MIDRVGPYRLVRELGRGGMGAVYLAERETDFTQSVALKMLSGVMDAAALRRFSAERRILASLDHPGIARLFDGGSTAESVPYLVMEYVEGLPIDRYCQAAALPTRAKITLFLRVCDAVNHAHRRLVVHRDLKPAHILITADPSASHPSNGVPKLLDFGIATLLEDAEGGTTSLHLLTPQYASPEQIRREGVSTASDVYALGLILYELLAGRRPYDVAGQPPDAIERIVCRQEPPKPRLGADLDTIVMKALRKEPEQRYRSVEALADDLQRYLDGRPVLARPATWTYVLGRFARRHPGRVAAVAAVVLTLIGFGGALASSAARARQERDAAGRVTSALIQLFSGSDLRAPNGDAITAQELVDRGAALLSGSLDEAAADAGSAEVIDSPVAARALLRLAESLRAGGRLAAAEAAARRSLAMMRRTFGSSNPQVGESLDVLSMIVYARGDRNEAERLFVEMTEVFRHSLGPTHPMVATGLHRLAMSRREDGDLAGAERLLREAIAIRRWIVAQSGWTTVSVLADVVQRDGRPDEAERMLREVVETLRAADHPWLGDAERVLAGQIHARQQGSPR